MGFWMDTFSSMQVQNVIDIFKRRIFLEEVHFVFGFREMYSIQELVLTAMFLIQSKYVIQVYKSQEMFWTPIKNPLFWVWYESSFLILDLQLLHTVVSGVAQCTRRTLRRAGRILTQACRRGRTHRDDGEGRVTLVKLICIASL